MVFSDNMDWVGVPNRGGSQNLVAVTVSHCYRMFSMIARAALCIVRFAMAVAVLDVSNS